MGVCRRGCGERASQKLHRCPSLGVTGRGLKGQCEPRAACRSWKPPQPPTPAGLQAPPVVTAGRANIPALQGQGLLSLCCSDGQVDHGPPAQGGSSQGAGHLTHVHTPFLNGRSQEGVVSVLWRLSYSEKPCCPPGQSQRWETTLGAYGQARPSDGAGDSILRVSIFSPLPPQSLLSHSPGTALLG